MPITKNGSGTLIETPVRDKDLFDRTGVVEDSQFALCNEVDKLKQIKFDTSAQTSNTSTTIKSGAISADVVITLPSSSGTLVTSAGSSFVSGPVSSTDNAVARFDGTGGATIQNSGVSIDDSGNLTATNFSGTNTGDITLAAVGSSPSANAASLSGQALTLQPADATHPGVVTTGTQTLAGAKTFSAATVLQDSSTIVGASDATKVLAFSNSGATAGKTLTLTNLAAANTSIAPLGTTSLPATGSFAIGAGTHALTAVSTAKLFYDNTNFLLGIGSASPTYPLDLINTTTNDGSAPPALRIRHTSFNGSANMVFDNASYSATWKIGTTNFSNFILQDTSSGTTAIVCNITPLDSNLLLHASGAKFAGAIAGKYVTSATNYTILATDCYVGISNTSSARTVTLCAANAVKAGHFLTIKDESAGALTNNITINRAGSDTIDGGTSTTIITNSGVIEMISDGTSKWFITNHL